jgi:hypothetical protein
LKNKILYFLKKQNNMHLCGPQNRIVEPLPQCVASRRGFKGFSSANMRFHCKILHFDADKRIKQQAELHQTRLVPKLARSTADLANGMELAAKISRCGRLAVCSGPLWAPSGWPTVSQGQAICPQDEMDFKSRYINRTDHNCPQAALRVKDNRP